MDASPRLAVEQPGGQGPHGTRRRPAAPPGPLGVTALHLQTRNKDPAIVYFNSLLSFWEWNRIVNLVVGQGHPAPHLARTAPQRTAELFFLPDSKGGGKIESDNAQTVASIAKSTWYWSGIGVVVVAGLG